LAAKVTSSAYRYSVINIWIKTIKGSYSRVFHEMDKTWRIAACWDPCRPRRIKVKVSHASCLGTAKGRCLRIQKKVSIDRVRDVVHVETAGLGRRVAVAIVGIGAFPAHWKGKVVLGELEAGVLGAPVGHPFRGLGTATVAACVAAVIATATSVVCHEDFLLEGAPVQHMAEEGIAGCVLLENGSTYRGTGGGSQGPRVVAIDHSTRGEAGGSGAAIGNTDG